MRLFVAVSPPAGVLDEVESAVAPYRAGFAGLRWTGRDRWHVTLSFLGEVSEDRLPRLRLLLGESLGGHRPLTLSFAGVGAFPKAARARVLWMGTFGDRRALTGMAAAVTAGARRAGIELDSGKRKFSPHLTLARCREPTDLRPLVETLSTYAGSPWSVDRVHLMRSRLGADPTYEILDTWRLSARQRRETEK